VLDITTLGPFFINNRVTKTSYYTFNKKLLAHMDYNAVECLELGGGANESDPNVRAGK
jgi:hypothetical protein